MLSGTNVSDSFGAYIAKRAGSFPTMIHETYVRELLLAVLVLVDYAL